MVLKCCPEVPIYSILEWSSKGILRFGILLAQENPLNILVFFMLEQSLGFKPISYAFLDSQTQNLIKISSNLSPMLCFSWPWSKFGLALASSKIYLLLFLVHEGFKPFLREIRLSSWWRTFCAQPFWILSTIWDLEFFIWFYLNSLNAL